MVRMLIGEEGNTLDLLTDRLGASHLATTQGRWSHCKKARGPAYSGPAASTASCIREAAAGFQGCRGLQWHRAAGQLLRQRPSAGTTPDQACGGAAQASGGHPQVLRGIYPEAVQAKDHFHRLQKAGLGLDCEAQLSSMRRSSQYAGDWGGGVVARAVEEAEMGPRKSQGSKRFRKAYPALPTCPVRFRQALRRLEKSGARGVTTLEWWR